MYKGNTVLYKWCYRVPTTKQVCKRSNFYISAVKMKYTSEEWRRGGSFLYLMLRVRRLISKSKHNCATNEDTHVKHNVYGSCVINQGFSIRLPEVKVTIRLLFLATMMNLIFKRCSPTSVPTTTELKCGTVGQQNCVNC